MTIELANRLRDGLEKVAEKHALPGLAVSVRRDGCEIFADGFGRRDANTSLSVSAGTLFGVASVTKFLTAIMIMQAQEQKLIKLSDPVSRFYPNLECASDGQMHIHHLLTHSAGFPGLPFRHVATVIPDTRTGANGADTMLMPSDLVAGINALNVEMLGSPGDRFSYSNESYCLLGGIIEDLHHCSFADAAERFVFQPLQMERSAIGGGTLGRDANLAIPLMRIDAGWQPCGFWDAPLFYPAGGLITSVRDMVRLISILDGNTEVLSKREGLDMVSKCVPIASRPGSNARYGLGLEVTHLDADHTLAWHTGQRPGISSFVGHVLQKRVSVAIATNVTDAPTASIGHQIIAEVLDGDLEPGSCIWPPPARHIKIEHLERFCGCFGSQEMGEVPVRIHQDRLLLDLQSAKHEFHFDGPSSGVVGGQTFCFLGDDGKAPSEQAATALALDLRVLPRLRAA